MFLFMCIRGWYAYHFPELIRLVPDNHQYARVVNFNGDKDSLNEGKLPDLANLLDDDTTVTQTLVVPWDPVFQKEVC